ncbi:hypothetical protein V6Z11_A06G076800 [Gossypium hirsutum]
MLDNIHAHWKRRRVCKIKCKGVCTVDMNNICEQLEERTGGKVIFRRGGVLFLFRGRNYNYKTRPRFPLMLWKPVTPVYPRLIPRVPEGLTLQEATEMRKKGRKLMPIRKLAKNGVYADLVKNVREAFEECELVRISCQGIKGSDYKKIGAKLKELVPCVLISFEDEHILMWRGNNWKSSFSKPSSNSGIEKTNADRVSITGQLEGQELSLTYVQTAGIMEASQTTLDGMDYVGHESGSEVNTSGSAIADDIKSADAESETWTMTYGLEHILDNPGRANEGPSAMLMESHVGPMSPGSSQSHLESSVTDSINHDQLEIVAEASLDINRPARMSAPCTERVLHLMKQAVESGSAVILDDPTLDADGIYQRSVAFARSAPPGPVFRRQPRKMSIQKNKELEPGNLEVKEVTAVPHKRGNEKQASKPRRFKNIAEHHPEVVPKGSLRVDELAKLLA